MIAFTQLSTGLVVANHLEAISHCPVTRRELRAAAQRAGVGDRLLVPEDGQTVDLRHALGSQVATDTVCA